MEISKKKDFVEIKYTGFSDGNMFDSNIEEEVKKLSKDAKGHETIVVIGESMVVPGLDKALEDKEIGKKYSVEIPCKDAFGERHKELVKMMPLKVFTEKQIMPQTGMILTMDNNMVKVISVSGARVLVDFNNPLAGKNVKYDFTIVRKITDEKEKTRAMFDFFLRFVPEFEIKDKIIVKGPKIFEIYLKQFESKFKELMGKDLVFEEVKEKAEEKAEKDKKVENKSN